MGYARADAALDGGPPLLPPAPLQIAPVEVRLRIDGPIHVEQDRRGVVVERDDSGQVVGVLPA
jgi:hypothetical protein